MPANRGILACLITVVLAACLQPDNSILIGLAGPFSEPAGRSMRLGAELAVSEINERGGVRGRRLELLSYDDRGQAATAVQMARRFRDNNSVLAVVGHAQSITTMAAAPVYNSEPNPVVAISPSASSVDLRRAGPYNFRVCPDDVAHAQALAERARAQLGIRRVATLYHNDRDSRTYAAVFRRAFTELGGTLLAEDPFSLALPSFEPYLTRAATRGRVDGLLIIGGGTIIGPILAALDSLGSRSTILGNMDLLRHAQTVGRDLEGSLLSTAYLSERTAPENVAFVTAYLQAHGGQRPDQTAAGSYDIVHLLANAFENRGPNRASVRRYLSGVGTVTEPFEGATGSIAFDADGNVRRISVDVGLVREGTIVPLPER